MIHVGVFRNERESERLLLEKQDGDCATAETTIRDGIVNGTLLRSVGGVVREETIEDVRYADFLSGESSDEQNILAYKTIRAFPQLEPYADYVFRPLKAGTSGEFEAPNEHFLFSGSRKVESSSYFDLVAFSGEDVATFAKKTSVPWLVHSGDKTTSFDGQSLFMHSLGITRARVPRNARAWIGAVGYQRKELRKFGEENLFPYIAIADKSTRTLWVVPFSLSRSAIGSSTLISPVQIEVAATGATTTVRFIVPEVPYHQEDFDTGMYTPEVKRLVREDSASFSDRFNRLADRREEVEAQRSAVEAVEAQRSADRREAVEAQRSADRREEVEAGSELYESVRRTSRVVVLQDGLEAPGELQADGTTCLCRFGRTLVVSVPIAPRCHTGLPGREGHGALTGPTGTIVSQTPSEYYAPVFGDGKACGAERSLLLCTRSPSRLTTSQWESTMRSKPAIVCVSEKGGILESDVGASGVYVSGIMVIVGTGGNEATANESRVLRMREISVPATRLMGPQSVVLYYTGGEYYFYRGALKLWAQCVKTDTDLSGTVAFGDRVEFSAHSVSVAPISSPFMFTTSKTDRRVVFGAALVEPERILSAVREIASHEELDAMRGDLALALVQLGVALDAAQMRDLKQSMLAICGAYVDALVAPIRKKRAGLVAALVAGECVDDIGNFNSELARLKFAERDARRGVQAIATAIEEACSVRDSSSKRGADLQTTQRAGLIAARVAQANRLSADELASIIERVPMYAIAELTDSFPELLRAARTDSSMEHWLARSSDPSVPSLGPLRINARCNMLEGDTVALALGTVAQSSRFSHFLASDDPCSTAFAIGNRSCLPLPVTQAALDWTCGSLNWMEVANEDEEQQLLRIKMRGMLSAIRGYELDAASPRLTLAIVSMVLSLAKDIALVHTVPSVSADRDDTRQQILRGVVYFALCTAASGKSPVVWNFQLTQPHADLKIPRTPGEWNLYADTLDVLLALAGPGRGPLADARRAAWRLIALVLRKACADPITAPMRKQLTSSRLITLAGKFRERDERIQWARACMLLFRACDPVVAAPWPDDPVFFELAGPTIGPIEQTKICAALLLSAPKSRMREYTHALRKAASGQEYDKAKIRGVGARYFVRFSGALADAKRRAIAEADRREEARVSAALEALQARRTLVARFLGVAEESVVPSNWPAFVEGDKAKMRGDEEVSTHKGPCDWYGRGTRGYTQLDVPAHATWRALLRSAGLDGPLDVVATAGTAGTNGTNGTHGTTAVATRALERVSSALTLEDVLSSAEVSKGTVASVQSNLALSRMFAALGLGVEDAREVVRICIREWRDVNAADEAAVAYLRNRTTAD